MPVVPTQTPVSGGGGGRRQIQQAPGGVGGPGPRFAPPQQPQGLPSQPAGGLGLSATTSRVADRIERRRLLQMKLDQREEDKADARRTGALNAFMEEVKAVEAEGLAVRSEELGAYAGLLQFDNLRELDLPLIHEAKMASDERYASWRSDNRDTRLTLAQAHKSGSEVDYRTAVASLEGLRQFDRAERAGQINLRNADGTINKEAVVQFNAGRTGQDLTTTLLYEMTRAGLSADQKIIKMEQMQKNAVDRAERGKHRALSDVIGSVSEDPAAISRQLERWVSTALTSMRERPGGFVGSPVLGGSAVDRIMNLAKKVDATGMMNLGFAVDEVKNGVNHGDPTALFDGIQLAATHFLGPTFAAVGDGSVLKDLTFEIEFEGQMETIEYASSDGMREVVASMTPAERSAFRQMSLDFGTIGAYFLESPVAKGAKEARFLANYGQEILEAWGTSAEAKGAPLTAEEQDSVALQIAVQGAVSPEDEEEIRRIGQKALKDKERFTAQVQAGERTEKQFEKRQARIPMETP